MKDSSPWNRNLMKLNSLEASFSMASVDSCSRHTNVLLIDTGNCSIGLQLAYVRVVSAHGLNPTAAFTSSITDRSEKCPHGFTCIASARLLLMGDGIRS